MSAQPLFEPPPPILPERQAFVMEQLHAHAEDGLAADEVGAMLHARRDKHDAGVRCQWCSSEGQSVLRALRKKGLVRRKRGGLWLALERGEEGAPAHDGVSGTSPSSSAQDGPGELPEGF
jgi:hypothetical protein